MSILLHFLAIIPGLLICYLIFRLDKYDPEPFGAMAMCFLLGAIATLPVIVFQEWSGALDILKGKSALLTLLSSFGVVAPSEEIIKCSVVLLAAFPRRFFDEPVDGIVYAVLAAMGFATVENIIYAAHFGLQTTIVRAFTAVPAHFVFAIVQGYYIGLAKFNPANRLRLILKGLIAAIFMHGIYDFLILQELSEWLSVLGAVSIYICLYYCGILIQQHLDNSPFKH